MALIYVFSKIYKVQPKKAVMTKSTGLEVLTFKKLKVRVLFLPFSSWAPFDKSLQFSGLSFLVDKFEG